MCELLERQSLQASPPLLIILQSQKIACSPLVTCKVAVFSPVSLQRASSGLQLLLGESSTQRGPQKSGRFGYRCGNRCGWLLTMRRIVQTLWHPVVKGFWVVVHRVWGFQYRTICTELSGILGVGSKGCSFVSAAIRPCPLTYCASELMICISNFGSIEICG